MTSPPRDNNEQGGSLLSGKDGMAWEFAAQTFRFLF